MTTADLIAKVYGVLTVEEDDPLSVISLTTTPVRILDNNPGGVHVLFVNTGSQDLMLWTDNSVSATKGIRLIQAGGEAEFDFLKHMHMPTREWWAVAVTGTTTISTKRSSILGVSSTT